MVNGRGYSLLEKYVRKVIGEQVNANPKLKEAIEITQGMHSIQEFFRYDWDLVAFGFTDDDILTLEPSQIHIVWADDLANAKHKIDGVSKFGSHFKDSLDKLPPVEVDFDGKRFTLQDGHHRYYLAVKTGQKLQAQVTVKANPFLALGIDDPDTFWNQQHPTPLNEGVSGGGKTLINVDIQPDYESYINFDLYEWAGFLNSSHKAGHRIVFLYNGFDTLGMVEEGDYRQWLQELGVKNKVLQNARFYDKGYNFFRNPMDSGIDESEITALGKYMKVNGLNDSRDLEEEIWDNFMEQNPDCESIRENLEGNEDAINLPDVLDELEGYSNIVLTGGGKDECLKEVEICLDILNKNYVFYSQFVY